MRGCENMLCRLRAKEEQQPKPGTAPNLPILPRPRAVLKKTPVTRKAKELGVVVPTPKTTWLQEARRQASQRAQKNQAGSRKRPVALLESPPRLPRFFSSLKKRFCRKPQAPNLALASLEALPLGVAPVLHFCLSPSPKPKVGRTLNLPHSPSLRSFSWPKPEKLAQAATH